MASDQQSNNVNPGKLAVIGLGYVGLPLAVEFGLQYDVVGFDINPERISELQQGQDSTLEVSDKQLQNARGLVFTTRIEELADCSVYIVTVPTPIRRSNQPDLGPLIAATRSVASVLQSGNTVIYESTVYPGATEEVCVPVLEQESGLKFNQDFFVGYSPERINPGDKKHRITSIVKVTSGSTEETAELVDQLYHSIVPAGTHRASSIRVAEAAKVIENTQRDVNIALVNELALLFNRLGIDTREVLAAAGSKWNFLPFTPGLVGGHCIGVDPYYLTYKAQAVGYHPRIILAGREINDGMGAYVADTVIKLMTRKRIQVVDSRILILGLTFKENCPDLRNTKVTDIISELTRFHTRIDVYDPWASPEQARQEYNIELISTPEVGAYDAVIMAVPHQEFLDLSREHILAWCRPDRVIYDVKSVWAQDWTDARL